MTDPTPTETTTENRCYRHPNRETFVKCQRCGRPICGQCQTIAPVGVHCPECVREARQSTSRPVTVRAARALSVSSGRPIVTYAIMALAIIGFILETVTGNNLLRGDANGPVGDALYYSPGDILARPWTLLTVNFVHANVIHLALNMLSLYFLGPALEGYLGRIRFAAVFVICGLAGDVGIDFFSSNGAVGASGAIFGVLGALFVLANRIGVNKVQLIVIGVINLGFSFWDASIAWQAHLGGLVVGLLLGLVFLRTAAIRRRPVQVAVLIVIPVVLLLSLLIHALTF
jgi:membrane associated rhomboid family serine protease